VIEGRIYATDHHDGVDIIGEKYETDAAAKRAAIKYADDITAGRRLY